MKEKNAKLQCSPNFLSAQAYISLSIQKIGKIERKMMTNLFECLVRTEKGHCLDNANQASITSTDKQNEMPQWDVL